MNINGQVVNGTGQLSVDIPANTAQRAVGQQQVQAHIVLPDHTQETVTLQSTAPLHWTANFPANQIGTYLLQVTWQNTAKNGKGGTNRLSANAGMVVPYSPEYRTQGTNVQFLAQLARAGDGKVLDPGNPTSAFQQNLQPVSTSIPLAFLLLILAALLLPLDIAARRLSSLEFLAIGYTWVRQRLRLGRTRSSSEYQEKENVLGISLESVRAQRQVRQDASEQAKKRLASRPVATLERPETKTEQPTDAVGDEQETARPILPTKSESVPKGKTGGKAAATMAERLLEAKRKRNGPDER